MKSETEVRKLIRAIRDLSDDGVLCPTRATAQLLALGWVLDALPEEAMKATDAVTSRDRSKIKDALARAGDFHTIVKTQEAIAAI